jgi:glycosyltransferase involved in cell wall biosynthesis
MGLEKNIRFLGYQKDVLSFMTGAQALLLPSIIEGLPGVILEAMYCRTPVVAYDVGGISEVVKNNETGWLVNAGDEDGFVRATKEVISGQQPTDNGQRSTGGTTPSLVRQLGVIKENAYQLVVSKFDNKRIAHRFLETYNAVSANQSGL